MEKVGLQSLPLRHFPQRKRSPDPATAGFFRCFRGLAKHVGILTGPDTFLHAYERLGVIEEPVTPTWRRRIAFAFLFPKR